MSASRIWDASTVASLDATTNKYERHGKRAVIVGLNEASTDPHAQLVGDPGAGH
ncbi:MFS superfamily sulfate permease-like transporter [Cryobacterium sp. MP_3.1]|nr:MFS superfamily sulfate permease-like transporter [Cryobacterium sp. MP_3.1]